MDRRGFLARSVRAAVGVGSVAGVVAGSGCVERIGAGSPSLAERDPPDRPASLTESSVVEYVAAVEEVRTHNEHVRKGATELDLTTTATFDYEAGDGYHVTAQHAGTVSHERNGERSVGELYSRPVPYRVTPEETIRLSVERDRIEGDGPDDGSVDAPLGVRLCNALDRPREVTLEVVRHETADGETAALLDGVSVIDRERTVGAREAIELRGIAATPGTYRVIAHVSENGVTGQGRIDIELPGVDRGSNVDVLSTPDGLSTRALPPFDPI
ncbi:hypothetical protein [Halorubrum tibetense]|uniref:Uncharacterized protein n=1 Tax=Halorubrum tibetense TaxID=175631 RepID=A0ABD5S8X5_9EURY